MALSLGFEFGTHLVIGSAVYCIIYCVSKKMRLFVEKTNLYSSRWPSWISLVMIVVLWALAGCTTAPSPVWQDMNYRMNNGKVGAMGQYADIGP